MGPVDIKELAIFILGFPPEKRAELLNRQMMGFDALMGLEFCSIDASCVQAKLKLDQKHTQPYGVTHGGVYATLFETVCSTGAAFSVMERGLHVVGAENRTQFLQPSRAGLELLVEAKPALVEPDSREAKRILWRAECRDAAGALYAKGEVKLALLANDHQLAAQDIELPYRPPGHES